MASEPWDPSQAKDPVQTRDQAAAVMLVSGADYALIAQVMDFESEDAAQKATERALAASFDSWDKTQLRKILTARLEGLWRVAYRRATNDRNPSREAATKNALSIVDRLAKLQGVDEPTQVVLHSATSQQINDWVARVTQAQIGALPQEEDIFDAEVISDETAQLEARPR